MYWLNLYYILYTGISIEEIAVNKKYDLCPHRAYNLAENTRINFKKFTEFWENRHLECYNLI